MDQIARSIDQIGNALRRRRRSLKLTQEQLCQRTGLRQATISAIETGDSGARLKTLFDVLAVLDLELVVRPRSKAPLVEDIF